jgi:hypothetical protein
VFATQIMNEAGPVLARTPAVEADFLPQGTYVDAAASLDVVRPLAAGRRSPSASIPVCFSIWEHNERHGLEPRGIRREDDDFSFHRNQLHGN